MKKRLLSLIMAVMMVVVLVVPAAAATTDTASGGTVTVYVTYGMFTEGGYDTAKKAPAKQAYNSDAAPTSDNINSNFYINAYTLSINTIKTDYMATTQGLYGVPDTSVSYFKTPNLVDAILAAFSRKALTLPIPTPCIPAGMTTLCVAIPVVTSTMLLRSTPFTMTPPRKRWTACSTMCIVAKAGTLPAAPAHPTSRLLMPMAPALLWKTV